jgi:hypothetical protein
MADIVRPVQELADEALALVGPRVVQELAHFPHSRGLPGEVEGNTSQKFRVVGRRRGRHATGRPALGDQLIDSRRQHRRVPGRL